MTEDLVMKLGEEALRTTAMVSAPLLGAALLTGVIISVIQAVTQINEATLSFVPKMIIIGMVLLFAGPWMLDVLTHYTVALFDNMSLFVRE